MSQNLHRQFQKYLCLQKRPRHQTAKVTPHSLKCKKLEVKIYWYKLNMNRQLHNGMKIWPSALLVQNSKRKFFANFLKSSFFFFFPCLLFFFNQKKSEVWSNCPYSELPCPLSVTPHLRRVYRSLKIWKTVPIVPLQYTRKTAIHIILLKFYSTIL